VKILFWTELYWPHIGGIEVRSHRLAVALKARDHEVAVITSHGNLPLSDRECHEGIEVRRYPFQEALSAKRLDLLAAARKAVQEFKRDFRPDLVHVFFTDPGVMFHWMTHSGSAARTIITVPIGLRGSQCGDGTLLRQTLTQADWVVAISQAMRSDVISLAPEIEGRCSVIYNSLDIGIRSNCGASFDTPTLLCVGRVVREKGFDLAIQALPEILRARPETRLLIAGDGPARPELEAQAIALGVAGRVTFAGWVDPAEIPGLIGRAAVVVVPSRWREAFGNVALQAMQMRRPVIATATGGLPEVVLHEVTGLLIPVDDATALVSATLRLLKNRELAERLGSAGKRIAETRFAFDAYVDEHERLYARMKNQ